ELLTVQITGARYDITPILEYSNAPFKDNLKNQQEGKKIYYFGGENQAFAYNAQELIDQVETEIERYNEKLSLNKSSSESALDLTTVLNDLEMNQDENSQILWKQYLTSGDNSLMAYPTSYYLNVPHIYQYQTGINHDDSACGPSSLAMAIQYLSSIGLSVHDKTYFDNSEVDMVNGFYNFLGTSIFGTTAGNMSYLTSQLLNMHMNGWQATSIDADDSGSIASFQDRVISSRPPLVMWDTLGIFPWLDPDVTWHWQTGTGYRTTNGVFEFGVKDPSSSSSATKYYSWTANDNGFLFVSYKQ
ncbi:hypothetical protein J7E73_06725, partial [Paenibacillus albidus]|uniref:hypothetical protein n=1 Tax=Paenibacillus albidus TaxID=2041023 RepID=UPI001BEB7B53